ncbi:unnamed protein product, partial [Hydatigera taeniaeformis]|uniref:WW domain-containing protein n=1 Tax=Hydatigena taeniaeformis TaxID=6205 RepID=A0A0R3WQQ4_HYDTA
SSSHSTTIIASRIPPNDHDQPKQTSVTRGKPEWQKNTLRVCGNWSEQLSSKGKVYFYNCITEVSQWQKPLEWTLPDMTQSQTVKRSYSTLSQVERVQSRLQDGASSPKRQRYTGSKGGSDRTKVEGSSYSHIEQHNLHLVSPRKVDHSGKAAVYSFKLEFSRDVGHGSPQRVSGNVRDSFEGVKTSSSLASSTHNAISLENHASCEGDADLQSKVPSGRVPAHDDQAHAIMPPKLATILASHSTRSPLLVASSSVQVPSGDPQPSISRSSSPSLPRGEAALTLRQHSANACQRRFPHDLPVVNNGGPLLPDTLPRDSCSSKSDRRSAQIDKQSADDALYHPLWVPCVDSGGVCLAEHIRQAFSYH